MSLAWEHLRRQAPYWSTVYARTWRGSVITSFISPLLYVVAMGVLLGGFVHVPPSRLDGASSYLAFVVPGMLAVNAMQLAVGETTYPVMQRTKWDRTYVGMLATPLRPIDLVNAHLTYTLARLLLTGAIFTVVVAPFGVFTSVTGAVGALLASLLTGLAFGALVYGFSAGLRDESAFALVFRLGVIPLTLFSGAFFPIGNLGPVLEVLARVTPLWHGVDLARMYASGHVRPGLALVHVGYLVAMTALAWAWSGRRLRRRLVL